MSAAFQDITVAQPTDGQQVYVRRLRYWAPFLMYWRAATQDFSSAPGDITLSGAGTSAVNGAYFAADYQTTLLGAFYNSTYSLGFDAGAAQWTLQAGIFTPGGDTYYVTAGAGTVLGPWTAQGFGTAPGPAVTVSRVMPWYEITRWRDM